MDEAGVDHPSVGVMAGLNSTEANIYHRSEEAGGGDWKGQLPSKRYLGSMSFRGFPEKQLLVGKVFTPGWTGEG